MESHDFAALWDRQMALETEMQDRGRDRYFGTVARCRERDSESNTSYGKMLLKHGLAPYSEAIAAFLAQAAAGKAGRRHKAATLLAGMDTDIVAFIAARKVMDSLSRRVLLQRVAVSVAREVELEQKLTTLQEQDKERYAATQRHIHGSKARKYRRTVLQYAFGKSETVAFEPWPAADCVHLGQKLIELLIESTGMLHIVQTPYKTGAAYVLEPTDTCREWIQRHQEHASLLAPDYLPTIIPPKPWGGAGGGGYYSAGLRPLSLVKTSDVAYLTMLDRRIQSGELDTVITAVNALQNTPWTINRRVLEVAAHLWDHADGSTAGLPPREGYRLPPCPVCGQDVTDTASARIRHTCLDSLRESDPPAFAAWKKAAAIIREKNVSAFSQRLQVAKTLLLARKFLPESRLYFPYQLDFRGRIYAVPSYLNPQGTDLAKALLHFGKGKPLGTMGAVRWLAIHGSNTWGNDKVSLDDRHSWTLQHQEQILACAADPYNNTWWQDANSPFCFLAFCFEWAAYVRQGLACPSRLPVAMDGTCNGLQIFSLILRDEVGGHAVNLTPSDTPQDIYHIVADKVIDRLKADAADPALDKIVLTAKDHKPLYNPRQTAQALLAMGITRKTTKRQVMVLPYGGTLDSCREYTEEWIKGKTGDGWTLPDTCTTRGAAVYLADHIWTAIGSTVIAARDAMAYLQDTAKLLNMADLPIRWTTPAGLPVVQKYNSTKERRIKTRIGDAIVKLSLHEEQDTLNKPKQKSAISPNYVHSLDAAALMKTVCACLDNGVSTFAMIHDSYGTYAADSDILAQTLRHVFIALFGGVNHLEQWSREVLAPLPMEIRADAPPLPQMGNLNVPEVAQAAFFFA